MSATSSSPTRDEGMVTLEEFQRMPEEDGYRVELSRGRVVREPRPGAEHGVIVGRIIGRMGPFVETHGLGLVVTETGFLLGVDPPTLRGPDAAFVALDHASEVPVGPWTVPPTIAVEVVSPSNTAAEIHGKVLEYLEAGTSIVWVVDPRSRTVTEWHPPAEGVVQREGDRLEPGEAMPGFSLAVSALFGRAQTR